MCKKFTVYSLQFTVYRFQKILKSAICYLLSAICLLPTSSQAQCAMCRASLESEGNAEKAEAVNDGIVYLMAMPYIIVAVIAFVIYKMYKNKKND